jgi:uncharacterized membrane protein required for colicin V production
MQKYNVSIWTATAIAVAAGAFVMAFVVSTMIAFFGGGFIEYCAFIVGFFAGLLTTTAVAYILFTLLEKYFSPKKA